jgi:hypothetical protein
LAFESASAQLAAGQNRVVDVVERSGPASGGTLQNKEPEAFERECIPHLEPIDLGADERRLAEWQ